jgi:hypothetical protein
LQGREINLLTITNPAISADAKDEIYIIGRQHAAETASSYMLKGMIDFLISDDDDASAMRNHFVWYLVPMVNPDGVYEGNSRATSELRDLNRDWGNFESDEINTVRGNIELIDNADGIDMFIDWHNQMNDVGWYNFVYSPPGNTFFSGLSNWTDFDQEKSLATSCTDESCSARGYATDRGLFTIVFEPTPHLSTWTIESLKQQGINTTYAIAEYFNVLPDIYPPTPDPMTWATAPNATGTTSISMTATTASDPSGVEYYFMCTAGGGHDSGWQDSATYEDTSLLGETQYTYRVQARDMSANNNETGWSLTLSATTEATPDSAPPMPDPMTWATAPNATGATSISMTATTASDPSGFEYYFDETSGNSGGSDSGWQDSASFTDTGLTADMTYTYRVQARDKSANQNMTAWSSTLSATTNEAPKSGCGATPMYGDGGQPHVSAKTSSANALLPLLPSMLALGLWGGYRAGGRRKNR